MMLSPKHSLSSHNDLARPHKIHSNPAGSDLKGSTRSCPQSVIRLPTLLILQVLGGRCRVELRRFAARAPGLASGQALAVRPAGSVEAPALKGAPQARPAQRGRGLVSSPSEPFSPPSSRPDLQPVPELVWSPVLARLWLHDSHAHGAHVQAVGVDERRGGAVAAVPPAAEAVHAAIGVWAHACGTARSGNQVTRPAERPVRRWRRWPGPKMPARGPGGGGGHGLHSIPLGPGQCQPGAVPPCSPKCSTAVLVEYPRSR